MAAVATVKPNAYQNLQLTFPSLFAENYKETIGTYKPIVGTYGIPAQSAYALQDAHQKVQTDRRNEAYREVMDRVHNTRASRIRYTTTPHGAGDIPKPVLSQRKFANPSFGAIETASARRDQDTAPFHFAAAELEGGVIRTKQGQNWIESALNKRIAELNRIEESRGNFAYGATSAPSQPNMGSEDTTTVNVGAHGINQNPMIEINLLLQRILDAIGIGLVDADDGRMGEAEDAFKDLASIRGSTTELSYRLIQLLFRFSYKMTAEELMDVYGNVSTIMTQLNGLLDPKQVSRYEGTDSPHIQIALTLQSIFARLFTYGQRMIAGVNMSTKDRQQLSKTLVKGLNLDRSLKYAEQNPLISKGIQEAMESAQQAALFSPPKSRREDTQNKVQRGSRAGFTVDTRNDQPFFGAPGVEAPHEAPMEAVNAEEDAGEVAPDAAPPPAEAAPAKKPRGRPRKTPIVGTGRTVGSGRTIKSHYNKAINAWDVGIM